MKLSMKIGPSKLSDADMYIAINFGDVIAVSDDNFDDFIPMGKPVEDAIK